MNRLWWKIVGGVAAAGVVVILILLLAPKSPVLPEIRRQVTSTVLLPKGGGSEVDSSSVKYNPTDKVFSFNMTYEDTKLVVSEQPTPEQFTDIPQTYDKVVSQMNSYATFDANLGKVHLTKPTDLKGKQVAVINTKGTLMFAKAEKDLSDDQWKRLFRYIEAER